MLPVTVNDMKLGTKIKFGTHQALYDPAYDDYAPEITWIKASWQNHFIAEKVIDLMCYDAAEPGFRYGNPSYALSNVHSFLNSECGDAWYSPKHENDRPPSMNCLYERPYLGHALSKKNEYVQRPGFLYGFHASECDEINPERIEVDGCRMTTMMRLPFFEEITCGEFPLFSSMGKRAHPTEDLCSANKRYSRRNFDTPQCAPTTYIPYFVICHRRPISMVDDRVYVINRQLGSTTATNPNHSLGIRPVCKLKDDAKFDLAGDGVFVLSGLDRTKRLSANYAFGDIMSLLA